MKSPGSSSFDDIPDDEKKKAERLAYEADWRAKNRERLRESNRISQRKYYAANREYYREYRLENRDRIREYGRKYLSANREAARKRLRRWRAANREKNREYSRRWFAVNPEKKSEYNRRHRAVLRSRITEQQWSEILNSKPTKTKKGK